MPDKTHKCNCGSKLNSHLSGLTKKCASCSAKLLLRERKMALVVQKLQKTILKQLLSKESVKTVLPVNSAPVYDRQFICSCGAPLTDVIELYSGHCYACYYFSKDEGSGIKN